MRKERTYILLLLATLLMASPVAYCVTPQDELDKEIASFAERAIRQSSPDDLYLMKWEIVCTDLIQKGYVVRGLK